MVGITALVVLLAGLALWLSQREPGPPPRPPATAAELLAAPAQREWRWKRLTGNEAVLVIEFPSLNEQGKAMNRLAALHEKAGGNRFVVLNDADLAALIKKGDDNAATFFMGHDYTADQLARFYSLAEHQRLVLNPQELQLREQLIVEGVMQREPDHSYRGIGEQAVVTFTALQADDPLTPQDEMVDAARRESVLRHELSHGAFFTQPAYRQQTLAFWRQILSEEERQMFRRYLGSIDYDAADEELMANETQALLLHTPDTRAFKATDLGIDDSALAALRQRFAAAR